MEKSALGIRPGVVIQDTYRVNKLLGEGGMGATFAGENLATNHAVAIKVITSEFASNSKSAELFRREANLLRTIQNDAVVRYETTMLDKSGQLYLVMEYIQGKPLSHFLERGARLAPGDVLKLAKRLLGGLAAIHRLGIVHRDISPDNIIIPDDNILGAKLIDFGVASDTIGTQKSIIGDSFAGKISYASPEQLGIGDAQVSAASDVYSLALVLMRVAGLQVEGVGAGLADAIDARRKDVHIPRQGLSEPLANALEQLLRADPRQRPQDPIALIDAAIAKSETGGAGQSQKQAPEIQTPVQTSGRTGVEHIKFDDDAPPPQTPASKRVGPLVVALIAVLALAGGSAWYFLTGPGVAPSGKAMDQAELAKDAAKAADPLSEVTAMISAGGEENLNAAFGALMAIARDGDQQSALRARASMMIAHMYDPQTFAPSKSPFPAANPRAALRFYKEALDLGAEDAQTAVERLEN